MFTDPGMLLDDPLLLKELFWPEVRFYDKQIEIIESVHYNDETVVVAANKAGKDFVAGYIALRTFIVYPEVRVITTSVKDDHLRVLWGEIGRYLQDSRIPLVRNKDNPTGLLQVNHRDIRKFRKTPRGEELDPISYLRGMVSEKGEGLAGHHAKMTLLIIDEASGIDDTVYNQGGTWAKRIFAFGNALPCENFFRRAVKDGDVEAIYS